MIDEIAEGVFHGFTLRKLLMFAIYAVLCE